MKNKLRIDLIGGLLILLIISCKGGINISNVGTVENPLEKFGEIEQSEVWSGVVLISGNVIVPNGVTLTIRPKTVIGVDPTTGTHELVVHGSIYVEGEENGMIRIGSLGTDDSAPSAGDWIGIRIEASSFDSYFRYCQIQDAKFAISSASDDLRIENCLLTDNQHGVLCDDADLTVTQSELNKNGTAIKCLRDSVPEIRNNAVQANEFGIICDDASRPKIERNILSNNYQHAIVCYSTAEPEIVANNITFNGGWAVYNGGRLRENFIMGNKESDRVDLGIGRDSDQFYGVDDVLEPRSRAVENAGVSIDR